MFVRVVARQSTVLTQFITLKFRTVLPTDEWWAPKLFLRHDGPYRVVEAFPKTSTYRLDISNVLTGSCPTFHAS